MIPPATGLGLNANVGVGEPVTPVNANEYGVPTVPAVGVPVKFGATPTAAAGNVIVRNAWSPVMIVLLVETRT